MTTFIARHGDRAADLSSPLQAAIQRFAHAFVSLSLVVGDAVRATRALNDAHTPADRRAVAARFVTGSARNADRSAA